MWLDHVVAQRAEHELRVYWNVNYFGVIRAIAMARAVVGHRERAVLVACWPSTIYRCSYELSIGLTTNLKTIDDDSKGVARQTMMTTAGEERTPVPVSLGYQPPVLERERKRATLI